jgi:DnaJ-class molecular chaperone
MNSRESVKCKYCEGKGYIEIRDCVGDIQYSETCSFCEGLGSIKTETKNSNSSK